MPDCRVAVLGYAVQFFEILKNIGALLVGPHGFFIDAVAVSCGTPGFHLFPGMNEFMKDGNVSIVRGVSVFIIDQDLGGAGVEFPLESWERILFESYIITLLIDSVDLLDG